MKSVLNVCVCVCTLTRLCSRGDSLLYFSFCCKSLASRMLLKRSKQMKSLSPILPTRLVTVYGATVGRLWRTTLPTVLISIRLDPLKCTSLASDLQRLPTRSKQSLDTNFCYATTQALVPRHDKCSNINDYHAEV
jgi:hypothetical protein